MSVSDDICGQCGDGEEYCAGIPRKGYIVSGCWELKRKFRFMLLKLSIMKIHKLAGLVPLSAIAFFSIGCTPPAYKPMDIAAYNQNTHQWKIDYNLYPLNPNWQYKLTNTNGTAPGTVAQCGWTDNPADWKSKESCTSQNLYYNDGQITCI